jgi:hypothetical protein
MGFVVPGFLLGLAFAAIPLIIHLIYRRKALEVVFAATRFLKVAARRTARRRRVDNLLLLLLRTALLGLLAFALAGPVLKRAAGGKSGSDTVIIIDNSLSMSAVEDGVPRMSRAKEAVEAILLRVPGDGLVALIPTAPPDSNAVAAFTADVSAVRARAARLATGNARGSLAAAFASAAKLFESSAAAERLLYVVTDLQANDFPERESLPDNVRAALSAVPCIVYDSATGQPRNLSVEKLSVYTEGAAVGTPLDVTAAVASNSPAPETVTVWLAARGERVSSRTVTIAPDSSADVELSTVIPSAGLVDGVVGIDTSDALAADNRRSFTLIARDRVKVLILKRESRAPDFDDDAFFLRRALDPFVIEPGDGHSPFEVTVKTYAGASNLGAYDIVFLLLRSGLEVSLSDALAAYVAGGGNLAVFPCDDAAAAASAAWLPARLVGVKSARRASNESFTFASIDSSTPPLSAFKDDPPALYNTIRVYDYWQLDVADKSARVIARFDTGDPAIILSETSAGRVALFTLAPIRSMSSLPASQFFLPLVYEVSYHLAASSGGLYEIPPGTPVVLAPAARYPKGLVVAAPDGSQTIVASAGGVLRYDSAFALGAYRIRETQNASDIMSFSVNPDPAESALARLDAATLAKRAPNSSTLIASDAASLDEALASMKPVLALGDVLLYAVLAVGLFECVAANRISGRLMKKK